jgi:anti-anti-sigma factor
MPFQIHEAGSPEQAADRAGSLGVEPFRVALHRLSGDITSVAPFGDLDLATVGTFERALAHALAGPLSVLVLDLRGLGFMDVAGLHRVLRAEREASARGVELVVIPGGPAIRRLFEVTHAGQRLRLTPATTRRDSLSHGPDTSSTRRAERRIASAVDDSGGAAGRALAEATGDTPELLTRRQRQILQFLDQGASTKEIAERLWISPATVRNHVSAILVALECHSRLRAVHRARKLGLL